MDDLTGTAKSAYERKKKKKKIETERGCRRLFIFYSLDAERSIQRGFCLYNWPRLREKCDVSYMYK